MRDNLSHNSSNNSEAQLPNHMTSIEWLYAELAKNNNSNDSIKERIYRQAQIWKDAKEMHKQETFVGKGSDEHKYYEQSRGINVNSFQSEAPKKEEYIVKVTDVTSSQTEISDEEIFKHSIKTMEERYGSGCDAEIDAYFRGAVWYREQLKKKQ
jgi:hypothetical protein